MKNINILILIILQLFIIKINGQFSFLNGQSTISNFVISNPTTCNETEIKTKDTCTKACGYYINIDRKIITTDTKTFKLYLYEKESLCKIGLDGNKIEFTCSTNKDEPILLDEKTGLSIKCDATLESNSDTSMEVSSNINSTNISNSNDRKSNNSISILKNFNIYLYISMIIIILNMLK